MADNSKKDLSYILNALGENRGAYFNAVVPPIIQSSNFVFDTLADFKEAIGNEFESTVYTRGHNPTVQMACAKVAALEGCEEALAFASGSAAMAGAIIPFLKHGDHIVCVNHPYAWTSKLIQSILSRFGVTYTFVDASDSEAICKAVQPETAMIILESPNSLTFEIQDLTEIAVLAKEKGIITVIDNSYASPLYQNPHSFGIDLIVHSGTKYINGHSDVVVGFVCGSKVLIEKIFHDAYMTIGGILSPNDAFLVLRGLRTLEIRMERSSNTALKLATWFSQLPEVKKVLHPFLPDFPQLELAKSQMKGCGGLFSLEFHEDDLEKLTAFVDSLKAFKIAVSWGGHESLVIPSAAFYDNPGKPNSHLPKGFVRFYVGLESLEYLKADVTQALEKANFHS